MTRGVKIALRAAAAGALLAVVIWIANPRDLARTLAGIDLAVFTAAVGLSILANLASAVRWAHLARLLDLRAPLRRMIVFYARGMTLNALLPGATLSGDVLRSYQLHQLGNPLSAATVSVIFDRASGLWILCLLSLAFALLALGPFGLAPPEFVRARIGTLYFAALALAVVVPLVLIAVSPHLPLPPSGKLHRLLESAFALLHRLRHSPSKLLTQVAVSLLVQLLSSAALMLCGRAIGVDLPYWLAAALAAPIFIMAAVPLSFGGWGTREVAAVAVMGAVGIGAQHAAATAILYGVSATIQAALAAPLFMKSWRHATSTEA